MRVDLIELLRCPHDHEPAPLVTVAYERQDDQLINGSLGCPTCHATFVLHDGIAELGASPPAATTNSTASPYNVERLAALLNLTEPGMRVALFGMYANAAAALEVLADSLCVAVNGAPQLRTECADQLSVADSHRFPFAHGAFHAIALDRANRAFLPDATRVVRTGGRILAPHDLDVPPNCRELARDHAEWVAQVTASPMATSAPVTLRRGSAYG